MATRLLVMFAIMVLEAAAGIAGVLAVISNNPQQIDEAISAGITTMIGGGTGPATGTFATTCTPGPWHIRRMATPPTAVPRVVCVRSGEQSRGRNQAMANPSMSTDRPQHQPRAQLS